MIKIIVDSTCDIPKQIVKENNIKVLPISVEINGKDYLDGVDLTNENFYSLIKEKGVFPKTAQINPSVFEEAFSEELEKGNEIICITLSSKLSGTYNSACIAKDMLDSDKIHIIDSQMASGGIMMVVLKVLEAINKKKEIDKILKIAENTINSIDIIVYLDTLEMLKRGGRIPKTIGNIGQILNIKPMLSIKDGELISLEKVKGKKKALRKVYDYINLSNIDTEDVVIIAHSCINETLDPYIELLREAGVKDENCIKIMFGAGIGTHVGENAVALIFISKEKCNLNNIL